MNSRVHVLSPVLLVLLCSCQAKKPPRESPLRSKPADLSFEWFVEKALFLGLAHHSLAVYRTRDGEGLGGGTIFINVICVFGFYCVLGG